MLKWSKLLLCSMAVAMFLFIACDGDGDKGTGAGNGGGEASLTGTWREVFTVTSANCPFLNYTDVETVTYEEGEDFDDESIEDCPDCQYVRSGNQYTIDCTCPDLDDECIDSYHIQGSGTISENTYSMNITWTPTVSSTPECEGYLACTMTMTAEGTRISSGPVPVDEPDISVASSSHNFGNVTVGLSAPWTLMVSNTGEVPLLVNSITSSSGEFDVISPTFPQNVGGGQSMAVTVVFEPISTGSKTATLTIASSDPDEGTVTINLSGTGVTDGGGGDLTGTWRVITTTTVSCPPVPNVVNTDTMEVTYEEGTTEPELPENFNCDMQTSGNTWTISCNYNETVASCIYNFSIVGSGSFTETTYQMTYDITYTVTGGPECSYLPLCTTHVVANAVRISP